LRVGFAAGLAVLAACLAHAAAGGPVDVAGAAWAFVGLLGPAWWLARRERGWGAIVLTQLGAQQLAHLVLAASAASAGHAGHVATSPDLMLYAHLVAAALAGAWLRAGERRAWAAVRRFLLVLVPPPALPWAAGLVRPAPRPPVAAVGARLLRHAMARRGPPGVAG
jgi:hypothetical protein